MATGLSPLRHASSREPSASNGGSWQSKRFRLTPNTRRKQQGRSRSSFWNDGRTKCQPILSLSCNGAKRAPIEAFSPRGGLSRAEQLVLLRLELSVGEHPAIVQVRKLRQPIQRIVLCSGRAHRRRFLRL